VQVASVGKGKACWECLWQHVSCSLGELTGRSKKWAQIRDGVSGVEELLAEIKGVREDLRGVTMAIGTWHRDRKSPMVQALRSLAWEIQDVQFWREDSMDCEESGTEGGWLELAAEVLELAVEASGVAKKQKNRFYGFFLLLLYACEQ
jgi:hypothetical protein